MPELIDATSHIAPETVLEAVGKIRSDDQLESAKQSPRLSSVEKRLEYMDRFGIDRQVINLFRPTIWYGLEPDEAFEAAQFANNEISRIAETHPDRFIPMGTIPFLTGEYLDEIQRCTDDMGMPAIQIFSNINGEQLDHPRFDPFWAEVDRLQVPVWIHPQIYKWHDYDEGMTWIYKMLGWPFDTGVAIARLLYGGVLDEYENVELVTHHLGGVLPGLEGRFYSWYQSRQEDPDMYAEQHVADLSQPVDAYLERVYADTATSSLGASYPLACGYEFFGADNIVYSADYPLGPGGGESWTTHILQAIDDLDISEEEQSKIYSGNVKQLLDL